MSQDSWDVEHNFRPDWVVDSETRKHRMDTCNSCEYLTTIKTCAKCSCFMPAKVWMKFTHCPLHKWEAVAKIPDNLIQVIKEEIGKKNE